MNMLHKTEEGLIWVVSDFTVIDTHWQMTLPYIGNPIHVHHGHYRKMWQKQTTISSH